MYFGKISYSAVSQVFGGVRFVFPDVMVCMSFVERGGETVCSGCGVVVP